MSRRLSNCILVLMLLLSCSVSSFGVAYKAIDLGRLGTNIVACDINDFGQIVGCFTTELGEDHAFMYAPGVGLQDLGTMGGFCAAAERINNAGEIIGWIRTEELFHQQCFTYSPDKGLTNLGEMLPVPNYAFDINDSGQVVGEYCTSPGQENSFIYSPGSGTTDLTFLYGIYSVRAINNSGQLLGMHDVPAVGQVPCVYSPGVGYTDLTAFRGYYTFARVMNDNGQVVLAARMGESEFRDYLFTSDEDIRDLGTLGGGYGDVHGMNNCGQVVGDLQVGEYLTRAFVYTASGGVLDLGTLGGELSRAAAINERGLIVGNALTSDGEMHVCLWQPVPEPSSLLVLGAGVLSLAGLVRRRGK